MEEFYKDFQLLMKDVKSSPLEHNVESILIPGEPELLARKKNQKKGIPVLPNVLEKLNQIASELDIKFDY